MAPETPRVKKETIRKTLEESCTKASNGPMFEDAFTFLVEECAVLISNQALHVEKWKLSVGPVLKPFVATGSIDDDAQEMLTRCTKQMTVVDEEEEEDDAEELCRCKLSLAYGSKVLLNNTDLRLKRGFRYGLLGPNECGKTTLMRAIANGQVEGFPPPDKVRTVFVEADILGELSHSNILDYIFAYEAIKTNRGSCGRHGRNCLRLGRRRRKDQRVYRLGDEQDCTSHGRTSEEDKQQSGGNLREHTESNETRSS